MTTYYLYYDNKKIQSFDISEYHSMLQYVKSFNKNAKLALYNEYLDNNISYETCISTKLKMLHISN